MVPSGTVARFHKGFPALLRKKFSKIPKKFCIVILAFFMGFKNEIFCNKTNFKTPKIYFLSKLHLKKLKTVWKCFTALFCHFWSKFGAVQPPKSLGQKIFFCGPFRVILKNFRPPGNSDPKRLVSLTISELTPLDPVALGQQLGFLGLAAKGLFSGHF